MSDTRMKDETTTPSSASTLTRQEVIKAGARLAIASAAAPALAAGLAVGPVEARSKSAAQTKTLSFAQFYTTPGAVKTQTKWFTDLAATWNKQNAAQIQLQGIPGDSVAYYTKLETSFAAGQGPDIFLLSPSDFLRYANANVLVDLGQYMTPEARADFYPAILATRIVGGKIYGLPMELEPVAMFYSVKAFEDAHLSEKDVPRTWDQFMEVAAKLRKGRRFGALFEMHPGGYLDFVWYPWLWMGGGTVVQKGGKHSAFNSQATIQALQFWQNLIKTGVAPRTGLGGGTGDPVANLATGYCAMQNLGIWGVSSMREGAPKFPYGIFRLPVPTGGTYATVGGGWAFVVNAKGQDPETAAKFVVWALGSMRSDSIQRMVDWCIKAKSDIAPRQSALALATKQGGYSSGPMKQFKDEVFPGTRAEPRFPPPVFTAISNAVQACMLNNADPKSQAAQAAQQIDAYLAGYHGAPLE